MEGCMTMSRLRVRDGEEEPRWPDCRSPESQFKMNGLVAES